MLIRPAQSEDALDVARVHVRAWQAGYRGLLPADELARLHPEERAQRYDFASCDPHTPKTLVAVDHGVICGFATTALAPESELAGHGELSAPYVDPDWWRRGVGTTLLAAARARLQAAGFGHALLWLLAGNVRGEHFYREDRWVPDGQRRTAVVWGISVAEIRYRRALDDRIGR